MLPRNDRFCWGDWEVVLGVPRRLRPGITAAVASDL